MKKLSPLTRNIILAIGIVILLGFGVAFAQNRIASRNAGEWKKVVRGDIVTGVEITGSIVSTSSVTIGPPPLTNFWDFKISMLAPEGSEVKEGQPIIGFDTQQLQDMLTDRQARADSAQAEIDKTRADLKLRKEDNELALAEAQSRLRKAELKLEAPDELIGAREREQYEVDFALAKKEIEYITMKNAALEKAAIAEISSLESRRDKDLDSVREIERNMQQMTTRAPRAGTVVYLADRRNEKKKVGDQVWRMDKIIELPDLEALQAKGEIDEADSGRIEIGQKVRFRLDAHPENEIVGNIKSIGNAIRVSDVSPLKVLDVDITLPEINKETMRPGMRFRGLIELSRAQNVLIVPTRAITIGEQGPYVMKRTMLSIEETPVEIGRSNEEQTEVISGLSLNDEVLLVEKTEKE